MNKWVVIVGVVAIEIAMSITLAPWIDHARIETTDFVNFYTAATIVREGNGPSLYKAETQDPILASILGRRVPEYFLHPPFEAALLMPLSYLSIEHAYLFWTLMNLALLGMLPLVLAGCVPLVARKPYLGLLGFLFAPALIALTLGQDSIVILFLMSCAYLLISMKRDLWSGIVLSITTIKFQYVLIVVLLLLFSRRWRIVAGFAVGCAILGLVSVTIIEPAGILGYFQFVRAFDLHGGHGTLRPELMVNWRGFLTGTGWFRNVKLYSRLGSIGLIAVGIWCARSIRTPDAEKLIFALCVAIALVSSPYAFFDDATILLLPIFIVMDRILPGRKNGSRSLLALGCVLVFCCPIVLMAWGGHYWWNSRIYLVFPTIVFFIVGLLAEIYSCRSMDLETAVA